MKKYEEPEIIVTLFDSEDVLEASDGLIEDGDIWPL